MNRTHIGLGIFVCTPLISVILGDDFAKAEAIVPWLLPFLPLTAVSNAPSNGLLGLGKLGVRFGIYAAGALVSLTLYITMIPLMPVAIHPIRRMPRACPRLVQRNTHILTTPHADPHLQKQGQHTQGFDKHRAHSPSANIGRRQYTS